MRIRRASLAPRNCQRVLGLSTTRNTTTLFINIINMFGTKSAITLVLLAATAVWSAVSPDETCGNDGAGAKKGYTCPSAIKCCSPNGYCGATDEYCLKTVGCQSKYSNSTSACIDPVDKVSISPDGTCGEDGVGEYGYRCPSGGNQACCSLSCVHLFLFFFYT